MGVNYVIDKKVEEISIKGVGDKILRSDRYFFFQAEDGIRELVRSRGLGDVYKRRLRSLTPLESPL